MRIFSFSDIRNYSDDAASGTTDRGVKGKLKKLPHKDYEDYTKTFENGHN